ncbi:MAG: hypothetical protein HQL66_15110 [Magnetococcales bacterium]|nr:hypothetical protein [Magnetococcales bacterium]
MHHHAIPNVSDLQNRTFHTSFPGTDGLQLRLDYDTNNNLIYLGRAAASAQDSDPAWRIVKYIYSNTNVAATRFADGSAEFTKSWTLRATYSY